MYLCNIVIISHCKKIWPFHLNKLKSSLPKDAFCQVWLKLVLWLYRRRFSNFISVCSLFCEHLPLENGGTLHLNNLKYPSPKEDLCQVWLKLAQWFWRRRFFKFVNVFSQFRKNLPLEKGGVLHFKKTESPTRKNALCQVCLKLAQWFWRRWFFQIC